MTITVGPQPPSSQGTHKRPTHSDHTPDTWRRARPSLTLRIGMLRSASDVIEISSSDENEPQSEDGSAPQEHFAEDAPASTRKGVCERNPLCTRGFKHGGFGGHCSLKTIVNPSPAAASAAAEPPDDKLPPGWTRKTHTAKSGTRWYDYHGPDGSVARTISKAWQKEERGTVVIAPVAVEASDSDKLPPGWTIEERSTGNCDYKVYRGPDGRLVKSMKKAWEKHEGGDVPVASSSKAIRTVRGHPHREKPSVKEAAPPPPSEAPVALKRERITRLPEPEDERVGKRIMIHLADDGGVWRSAKILDMKLILDRHDKSCKGYTIRYDKDGKMYSDVELDKPGNHPDGYCWKHMGDDDEVDVPFEGMPPPPPTSHTPPPPPAPLPAPTQPQQPQLSKADGKRPLQATSSGGKRVRKQWAASPVLLPRGEDDERPPHTPVSQLVEDAIQQVLASARDTSAAAADDLLLMRKLRAIEWFAGSARLAFALKAQGFEVVIHDRDRNVVEWAAHGMEPDAKHFWSNDFLDIDDGFFYTVAPYDYMHFGIDCSSFSRLGHAGQSRSEDNDFLGSGLSCQEGNRLLSRVLFMIEAQLRRNPHFLFTIENPFTGRMKDVSDTKRLERSRENGGLGAKRIVLDVCHFWDGKGQRPFHKRTVFWTNSPWLIHEFGEHTPPAMKSRFLCERATPCQWYGTLGHRAVDSKTAREATPYPSLLVSRIAQSISRDLSEQRWRPLAEARGGGGGRVVPPSLMCGECE